MEKLYADYVGASNVNMFKNKIDIHFRQKSTDTLRLIGWNIDKPNGFLVHLPSKVNSLCDNRVKSLDISTHNT